jgi:hypothetical protein
MKVARLKFDDEHQPYMEGNFSFYASSGCGYSPVDFAPIKNITFQWSPEVGQDLYWAGGNRAMAEVIAERLKQDFIEFIMSYEPEPIDMPISFEQLRNPPMKDGHLDCFPVMIDTGEVEDGLPVMDMKIVFSTDMGKKYEWVDEKHKIIKKINT